MSGIEIMSFNKISLKSTYNSEEDSIINDFYIPNLGEAVAYDRAVGFFSASMLTYAAQGLSKFASNNGEMRLIIGHQVDDDEFEAIKKGERLKETYQSLNIEFEKVINDVSSDIFNCRLELLSWLVSTNRLKIKFAIRRKGMYHEKIGILKDEEGNKIVFQGSANESQMALLPDFNFESISVYPSWEELIYERYGASYEARFERLWNNNAKETVVVDVPSEIYAQLCRVYQKLIPPPENIEQILFDELSTGKKKNSFLPALPKVLGILEYQLKDHQKKALSNWKSNDFNGIFALATGAGKTITALHAATQLANYQKHLALVVAVPYQNLADQWCEVMELFSITAIRCYMSKANWQTDLSTAISDFNLNQTKPFIAIVVVNRTLTSEVFQKEIQRIKLDKMLFVGDECHHHASKNIIKNLPEAKFRIGLSATPWSSKEEDKEKTLKSYYGDIVAEYSIADALSDNVLTPYHYFIHPFYLTPDETEAYQQLSVEIGKLIAIREQGGSINEQMLTALYMKRARLIGSAENKFSALDKYLKNVDIDKHTLFYCGDGAVIDERTTEALDTLSVRDIEQVAAILQKYGWKSSRFTADESLKERRRIIDNFKNGFIDAMVSIRVLDEGIDIPVCKQAFLLASSRNERQFIQRRGRILRKSSGKEFSIIHDFIVLPSDSMGIDDSLKNLVDSELDRLVEFAHVSINKLEIYAKSKEIASFYNIDWLTKIYEK
jgi:superfamily II DNA or RNA helicase